MMRIELNAKVRTRDGHDVGHVTHVLFDPEGKNVHGVIASGVLGPDHIIPIRDVERATSDGAVIVLDLSRERFERLEKFVADRYAPPPLGWVPPAAGIAQGLPTEAYLWAATIADTAPHLEPGSPVVDRDGDEVGVVADVDVAPQTGKVQRFTVKVGSALGHLLGQPKEIELLPSDVARVEAGEVRLRHDKEDLIARGVRR
jgi:sporulation protein YlmC with PRC-barrel domain